MPKPIDPNCRLNRIVRALSTVASMTPHEVAEEIGVPYSQSITSNMHQLVKKGRLEIVGKTRRTKYGPPSSIFGVPSAVATVTYADGTQATGVLPLPAQSPVAMAA